MTQNGEYKDLTYNLGGDWIDVSGGNDRGRINPLQIKPAPQDEENEEIKEKQEEKQEEIKNSEIELLGNRIKELEEKLVRNQAELINYKRRKDDEVSRMLKYSQEDIILEILPIIDNFERAIKLDDNNLEDELSK